LQKGVEVWTMLFAECCGKLGRDGSRAHDRAEDLLTSTAFQLLRYLPLDVGLMAVLKQVRAVHPNGRLSSELPEWLMLRGITEPKYDFWPHWGKYGQPDVVVTLYSGTTPLGRLVVEVKLDANKSGFAEDEEATEAPDPDQLRRYWQGLKKKQEEDGVKPLGVVYLTSHAIPPSEELKKSMERERDDWLGWLSWRDVWAAMRVASESLPAGSSLPASDLAEILAAKGLKAFEGFGMCVAPKLVASPSFWNFRWFEMKSFVHSTDPHFWNRRAS
jgi:hypothetical protein